MAVVTHVGYMGICGATGKRIFGTRRDARKVARLMPSHRLAPFLCSQCGFFHLGHLPDGWTREDARAAAERKHRSWPS